MDFQQIRDFVNPAVAQATGIEPVENLSMPVPVAYVPVQLVIDGALSLTSENPVQNKVIAVAIQQLDGRITAIEGQFSEGVTEAVNNWLAAHPEATTTVQDGAITYAKLDANLKGEVDQISELKSAISDNNSNVILSKDLKSEINTEKTTRQRQTQNNADEIAQEITNRMIEDAKKANLPLDQNNIPTYGTSGKVLRTLGNGRTEWAEVGLPTDEQTGQAVAQWLDNHPEATTTVQDGSLTFNKFSTALANDVERIYETVSEMVADTNLTSGRIVSTKGYYSANDGGDAIYIIQVNKDTTRWNIKLNNNLYASMISEITFKSIGMVENQNNDSIMSDLIQLLQDNEDTKQFIVYVDGYNFRFTIIEFTNCWNLTLTAVPSGHGHIHESVPHIICQSMVFYVAMNCKLYGLNISGVLDENEQPTDSVIKFRATCKTCIVEQCYIRHGTIGIDIGTAVHADDTAPIIIEKCFITYNDVGIKCGSGNGRVYAHDNGLINNVNNIVIDGGVNDFFGNVGDCYAESSATFVGDILINGGGLTLVGHDADEYQGYMISGTPSLPVTIVGCRHYDSSMTPTSAPDSIVLNGSTKAVIEGCYLYGNIKINIGNNYRATISSTHLINGSISGTGKYVIINSDGNSICGTIRNHPALYNQTAATLEQRYGLLMELMKNDDLSSIIKTQNGIRLLNNSYEEVDGTFVVVKDTAPITEYSLSDRFEFHKYYNNSKINAFAVNLDYDIPYISIGDKKIYFTTQNYIHYKATGDIRFTGNTTSPFLQVWDGTQWKTII